MTLDDLLRKTDYLGERDVALLTKAYETASKAPWTETGCRVRSTSSIRWAVADILADLRLDSETLATAMLHDVVEDTSVTLATSPRVRPTIAKLVNAVTKLDKISIYSSANRSSREPAQDAGGDGGGHRWS